MDDVKPVWWKCSTCRSSLDPDKWPTVCGACGEARPDQPILSAPDEVYWLSRFAKKLREEYPLINRDALADRVERIADSLSRPKGEEMVERVAKALRDVEWGEAGSWDQADETDRNYWMKSARAAIAALGSSSLYEEDRK